jgi:hypothetical protein
MASFWAVVMADSSSAARVSGLWCGFTHGPWHAAAGRPGWRGWWMVTVTMPAASVTAATTVVHPRIPVRTLLLRRGVGRVAMGRAWGREPT